MNRNLWIKRAAALLLALALLSCAGCSVFRRSVPEATAEPTASPEPTAEPVRGGTLRLPIPVNASFEDPFDVDTEEMLNLYSLMYDKLLSVSANGEIEPCLCESWTSEGSGVWLLKLREGVKWHDSGVLTARDVIYTYTSLVEAEDSYYKPCLDHILGIEEVDDQTLRASLDIPGLMGLYSLVFPVKKEASLIGTGAYKLARQTDDSIMLRVNEEWWDKQPYIELILFYERDSTSTALASYEANQLNMVPTDLLTAGKYGELGVTDVHDIMTQNMEVLLFDHESSVFRMRELRLAVAHAVNRSRIITNVYMNRARMADSPIPPDSWLNSTTLGTLGYDPEHSLTLVEDAGFTVISGAENGLRYSKAGESLSIKLLTSATTDNTVRSDAAAMIASELESLGFAVEIITKKHTLGSSESEFVRALREGGWDMALVGFNLGLGNELSSYVDSDGANNFGHINDPELEALSRKMMTALTEEELREAARDVQDYFLNNVPFVTLYFRLNSIICSAEILGMEGTRKPFIFADIKNWYIMGRNR